VVYCIDASAANASEQRSIATGTPVAFGDCNQDSMCHCWLLALGYRYLALVLGRLEGAGIIDFPLQDKPAVTLFSVLEHSPSGGGVCVCWSSHRIVHRTLC
jgi:hypothetical protein